MNEEEYWQTDPEFDDDGEGEFGDTFLSEEITDDEVNVILIPKFEYDLDAFLKSTLKTLKKCKTSESALDVLAQFFGQAQLIALIENERDMLQEKVAELEHMMSFIKFN